MNIALEGRAKTQKLMKRGALSVEYLTTQLVGHTTIVTKTRVVGDKMTVVRSETSPFTSNNFENDQIMSRMCVKRGGREVEILETHPPKAMFMETGARPTAIAPAPMTIVEARQGYINITVPIGKKGGDMMEMKTMILIPFGKKEGDVFEQFTG